MNDSEKTLTEESTLSLYNKDFCKKQIDVTVIIPVWNSEKYLCESLDSVIKQTLKNIEIVCIYDQSKDKSLDILNKYAQKDARFKIIINTEKKGLAYALNKGLEIATGRYIARMDSDDICLPDRLKKQVNFLDRNKNIGACGARIKKFGAIKRVVNVPTSVSEVRTAMFFNCCVMHPTILIRRELLEKNNLKYNEHIEICEDYDFWIRCLKYFEIVNLPQVLLLYREHSLNISKEKKNEVNRKSLELKKEQFKAHNINISDEDYSLIFEKELSNYNSIEKTRRRFMNEIKSNKELNAYLFKKYLNKLIFKKLKYYFVYHKDLKCIAIMCKYNFLCAVIFFICNFYKIRRIN